jgi:hypothetical protein
MVDLLSALTLWNDCPVFVIFILNLCRTPTFGVRTRDN